MNTCQHTNAHQHTSTMMCFFIYHPSSFIIQLLKDVFEDNNFINFLLYCVCLYKFG
eukprot:m.4798 g.4798  ORF g.4798 m.4798 type:complete len:56 (-) comp2291_c0_seq1:24-191(-)